MKESKELQLLKKGHESFRNKQTMYSGEANHRMIHSTGSGQSPHSVILSCIDSRVPVETIFDQGIGDVFSARVAGNFVNPDILGSMEFACAHSTAKLIMVLGHTECGAVKGACDHNGTKVTKGNNLISMLSNIMPSVNAVDPPVIKKGQSPSQDPKHVKNVTDENVRRTMKNIKRRSKVLNKLIKSGDVVLVGAVYNVRTGIVDFWD